MNNSGFKDDQIAGQMIMTGFSGTQIDKDLMFLIDTLKVGGVILFSRNIKTPEQLEDLCFSIQEYAKESGQPPLFIAIDQEGGKVARLQKPFTIFPGNSAIKSVEDAAKFAEITASELKDAGINMNMAPVLDTAPPDFDSIMKDRMFGTDPEQTSELGAEVIRVFQQNKIMAVAKHFPGIGRTSTDSHFSLPIINKNKFSINSFEIIPFQAAVNVKVAGIMLSHILYIKIDSIWPASLSKTIVNDILRSKLGYEGIVITDDINMGAIEKYYDFHQVIGRIMIADVDIALICENNQNVRIAFDLILNYITSSPACKKRCKRSLQRIIKTKNNYLASE